MCSEPVKRISIFLWILFISFLLAFTSPNKINASSSLVEKQGIFVGLADNHTISILVDNLETLYQVDPELMVFITENLKDKDAVWFTYETNDLGENVINSIYKLFTNNGVFKTYIDAHCVSISIDGRDKNFQVFEPLMQEMISGIKEGSKIKVSYIIDIHNQNIVKSFEKAAVPAPNNRNLISYLILTVAAICLIYSIIKLKSDK